MFEQALKNKSGFQQSVFCLLAIFTVVWIVLGVVWIFPYDQMLSWANQIAVETNSVTNETAVSDSDEITESSAVSSLSPEILRPFKQNQILEVSSPFSNHNQVIIDPLPKEEPLLSNPLENAQLIIPSLGLSETITQVPIVSGDWDISNLGAQVGHLQSTATAPNQDQAMTFIGHATVPWPGVGPFANLILVEHGEEIIYRWNGKDYVYEVSRILLVNPSSVESLYAPDGDMIILATCSNWDFIDREYDKRLVTQATLVRVESTSDGK